MGLYLLLEVFQTYFLAFQLPLLNFVFELIDLVHHVIEQRIQRCKFHTIPGIDRDTVINISGTDAVHGAHGGADGT